MRSVILRIISMMIAFGVGLGADQVFSRKTVPSVPATQNRPPAPLPPVAQTIREVTQPPPPPAEQPAAILDYDENKFYADGGYSLIGKAPKEFRDFQFFNLESAYPVTGRGYLYIATGPGDSFDMKQATFALVTRKRMFWVSPPMSDGFEYRFDGAFLPVNFEKVANTNKPVLKGTLTKTKNGRKVAELVVSFAIEYDMC